MSARRARQAVDALAHRGPDDSGCLLANSRDERATLFTGEQMKGEPEGHAGLEKSDGFDLALGFRRLAILDLSPTGRQPMTDGQGAAWIVFNGEVYNYQEIRRELEGVGVQFRGRSDTEVVLAAYRRWGPACVERFVGMWALTVWDVAAHRLFLSRDRFGIKPLYYTRLDRRGFAFASEIKALTTLEEHHFQPDVMAIYRFLMGGSLPDARSGDTFFSGIRLLPPATNMIVDLRLGAVTEQAYWQLPEQEEGTSLSTEDAVARFRDLLEESVRIHLQSDVPIGTCLSGGLDSTSIVLLIQRLMHRHAVSSDQIGARLRTYSAVYAQSGRFNEKQWVDRAVAASEARPSVVLPDAQGLQDDLDALVYHQEEPFPTTSIYAQWCVMRLARVDGAVVLLDGQGADEMMGGYRPFQVFLAEILRRGRVWTALREALSTRHQSGLSPGRLLAEASVLAWLPGVGDWFRHQRARRERLAECLRPDFRKRAGNLLPPDWIPLGPHRGLHGHLSEILTNSSLPHLLRYEDRNSMAFGIESRVPFLDHRLVEFCFGAGASCRMREGWTKWILRRAMDGVVPSEICWRKDKVGFETPEESWLKEFLTARPDVAPQNSPLWAFLDPITVRERAGRWLAETGKPDPFLWRCLILDRWLSIWGGNRRPRPRGGPLA